ncbi:hypothetical protein CTEN210_11201 [Chaetoceros tenuissimus]|uniref:Uncharacterized protein n=1 Tax=Chaetoceros tenuissimus TaxID=426638 RepID=A0AAD3H8W6_9STRA|nr:hypothetical protein CTEN210_11201 [Chaetoceros tenuissimus]
MLRYFSSFSHRTSRAAVFCTSRRTHASSTTIANINIESSYGEQSSNVKRHEHREFSTAVQHYGGEKFSYNPELLQSVHSMAEFEDIQVLGTELTLKEAGAVVQSKEDVFDKVIILVAHTEAEIVTKEHSDASFGHKAEGDIALTSQGIGHAFKMTGTTGAYCNPNTELVPQLFVVPPLRCAIETALISFPYNCPGSISETKWVAYPSCSDSDFVSPLDGMKKTFSGIDYSLLEETDEFKDNFLSWLKSRDEKIIAIASTPSWIDNIMQTIDSETKCKPLRAAGIKFCT